MQSANNIGHIPEKQDLRTETKLQSGKHQSCKRAK